MKKPDICCIGHITLDKIITPKLETYMPGGTAFYVAHALEGLAEETDPATGKVFHKVPSSLVVRESTRPPIF